MLLFCVLTLSFTFIYNSFNYCKYTQAFYALFLLFFCRFFGLFLLFFSTLTKKFYPFFLPKKVFFSPHSNSKKTHKPRKNILKKAKFLYYFVKKCLNLFLKMLKILKKSHKKIFSKEIQTKKPLYYQFYPIIKRYFL